MTTELSPTQTGEIATSAYELRESTRMLAAALLAPNAREIFDITGGARLVGSTGMVAQQRSGFGYVAWGQGARQGECLVTVRGTITGYDWLTNFRFGGVIGPSGYLVHAGFWRGAQSVLPQIRRQLRGRNPSTLHVVGHSLGGAMATLLADSLSNMGCAIKLYTFGAPRCGVEEHAEYLTSKFGAENIYRAYHDTDPVPMVPVFPYFHVPYGSNAYRLKGAGTLINIPSHLMPSYRKSVEGCAWASLPVILPKHNSFEAANEWLSQASKDSGPFIMASATALRLILSALDWIVKQVGRSVALQLFAGATLLDGLARLLYSGALMSIEMAETISNLMNSALRFMGRVAIASTNITVTFIEYVLGLLFRFVAAIARRAVDLLD
ncbi:lipase family protein [Dyella humi]|uniref:Lipase family protein n=1 Tax=Dyella humi TaxID=1770547 RepID=A0ABW8IDJ0_9GAMM